MRGWLGCLAELAELASWAEGRKRKEGKGGGRGRKGRRKEDEGRGDRKRQEEREEGRKKERGTLCMSGFGCAGVYFVGFKGETIFSYFCEVKTKTISHHEQYVTKNLLKNLIIFVTEFGHA